MRPCLSDEDLPLTALDRARKRYSRTELLIRYARGRVAFFWIRQIMTLLGVAALWFTNGAAYALSALGLALVGEGIDCLYLRRVTAERLTAPTHVRRAFQISTLTAGLQSLTIAGCVALGWFGPLSHSAPLFALAFLVGAVINAGIVMSYHPAAAKLRLAVYGVTLTILLLSEPVLYEVMTKTFALNLAGAAMLVYMAGAFLSFVRKGFVRNRAQTLDLLRNEAELIAAKRVSEESARSKAEFLATMSHEIRTPMNGIVGMSDLLCESGMSGDQKLYAETIRRSADGLLAIINDILDLSKLDAQKMTLAPVDFDLRAGLEDVVQIMRPQAEAKGIDLNMAVAEPLPGHVHADDGRLRQILINLVGNAIKFTETGAVSLSVGVEPEGEDHLLRIAVTDTGIGIPDSVLAKIFDRFSQAEESTTRRFGGTGLGLTISKLLAEAMGGDITVMSQVDKGSTFTLSLRVGQAQGTASVSPSKEDDAALLGRIAGLRVLVAEDNRVNRMLMEKFLGPTDVTLEMVENGELAVAAVQSFAPDIVFMDMSMPVMDGIDATRAIRATDGPQPMIVALTANAFASDRSACLNAGMDGFLSKPVRRRDIWELLAQNAPASIKHDTSRSA